MHLSSASPRRRRGGGHMGGNWGLCGDVATNSGVGTFDFDREAPGSNLQTRLSSVFLLPLQV